MNRTISVMLGKGSVSHNSRKFMASNIDGSRTGQNISYCNMPIKKVYHELFDDALERYNAKQTRGDRKIQNYYEKIRTGKQEKLFHEVIFQIGNLENMSATSPEGELAKTILDEFMQSFEKRNPQIKVFSAHLHMDEATPHLHIDFVPFIAGSKRGLDTRVSLKQALAAQGHVGGSRGDTEWGQWVRAEKKELAIIMERHGLQWEKLGTHDEHLSVLDYKKEQRVKEVQELGKVIGEQEKELDKTYSEVRYVNEELQDAQKALSVIETKLNFIYVNADKYDVEPEYQLPEPKAFMSAKGYHEKIVGPLVKELKKVIKSILVQFHDAVGELKSRVTGLQRDVNYYSERLGEVSKENNQLKIKEENYTLLERGIGKEKAENIIYQEREKEVAKKAAELEAKKQKSLYPTKHKNNKKREYER